MTGETLRLDKWLWFARFAKTRGMVQTLIERGQVSVNGARIEKMSTQVRAGDTVAVILGPVRRTVIVRDIGERRGSPTEARTLFDEPAPAERLSWEEAGLPLHRS